MPILKNAKKALRVSLRKTEVNRRIKSRLRTALDVMITTPSSQNLSAANSALAKAVKRNLFHRNTAARKMSQLAALVK